jgi:hypothetical protein
MWIDPLRREIHAVRTEPRSVDPDLLAASVGKLAALHRRITTGDPFSECLADNGHFELDRNEP